MQYPKSPLGVANSPAVDEHKIIPLLRRIKRQSTLTKTDLEEMYRLSDAEVLFIVERISRRRQKLILKYIEELPYLEEDFSFALSRKESINTDIGADDIASHMPSRARL